MTAYYNENDPKAAAWLRELTWEGLIAPGDVDERSIEDVTPNELVGYTQCHFFAGIGGRSYALRLAGWPDERPVWTGSCPCQPFSAAGEGKGFADERHLWPSWFHLIRECRPGRVFGEQVANALPWFDLVQTDLENEGYAVGGAIVGAHSVGAPHIRQRIYWVAHHHHQGRGLKRSAGLPSSQCEYRKESPQRDDVDGRGAYGVLVHATGERSRRTPERFLERKEALHGKCGVSLTSLNLQASWATPRARDWRSDRGQKSDEEQYGSKGRPLPRQALGCGAETESGGQLNPAHSRWLMGFPAVWDSCGATAMQSFPRSRRRSSKQPDWLDT